MIPSQLDAAIDSVMIGGNHLATMLLNRKIEPSKHRNEDYNTWLAQFGIEVADVGVAWKAIMDLRDLLEANRNAPMPSQIV